MFQIEKQVHFYKIKQYNIKLIVIIIYFGKVNKFTFILQKYCLIRSTHQHIIDYLYSEFYNRLITSTNNKGY